MSSPRLASYALRVSLAAAFLSAVADRFGLWGKPGAPNVAWGDFGHFTEYTATLNPYLPPLAVNGLASLVTFLEVLLAVLLLAGFKPRLVALSCAALLLTFGLAMALTIGVKAPLDYSVFSAVAAALGLAALSPEPSRAERPLVLEGVGASGSGEAG